MSAAVHSLPSSKNFTPQEAVLYALVKEHLEDFLQHARESYPPGMLEIAGALRVPPCLCRPRRGNHQMKRARPAFSSCA